MICSNCLFWPVNFEGELCQRCFSPGRQEVDPQELALSDLIDRRSVVRVRALRDVQVGELVVMDIDVSDRVFPDIDQMLRDIEQFVGIPKELQHRYA